MIKVDQHSEKNTIELPVTTALPDPEFAANQGEDEDFTMDDALSELSSTSCMFQIYHSVACVILWGIGNQFFYSIPFYQAYPKLNCEDQDSKLIADCDHKMVCETGFKGTYEIDWKDSASL